MPAPMSVLHLVPRGGVGGAQLVATRLAAHQQAGGHRVEIASGPPSLAWDGPVSPLPRLERNLSGLPAVRRAIRRVIAATQPDVVHCHGIGLGLALGLATRRGRSIPAIITVHGLPEHEYRRAARVLRAAGLPVVAVASVIEERLRARGLRRVRTIANGVPPVAPVDRAAVHRRWPQLPTDMPLLVCAGRFAPEKGHLTLVEAAARLQGVAMLLLGEGPMQGELLRRIEELSLEDRVVLGGWQRDAAALVGAADVAAQPSNVEMGQSLAALEALQAGVPLITGRSATYEAVLRDGQDALIVDGTSDTEVADAIRRILEDPELAGRLRAGGARVAVTHSFAAMAGSYEALYRDLVRRRHG